MKEKLVEKDFLFPNIKSSKVCMGHRMLKAWLALDYEAYMLIALLIFICSAAPEKLLEGLPVSVSDWGGK